MGARSRVVSGLPRDCMEICHILCNFEVKIVCLDSILEMKIYCCRFGDSVRFDLVLCYFYKLKVKIVCSDNILEVLNIHKTVS